MKRRRYAEPQIVFALQQAETGAWVGDIWRKLGVAGLTGLEPATSTLTGWHSETD